MKEDLEFVFHKVDDSCKHEVSNPEFEIVLRTRYKQTHEAQDVLKQIKETIEKAKNWDTMIKYWSKTYTHDENLPSPNTDLSCSICGEKFNSVCMLSHNESASFSFIGNSREHFKKHGMKEKNEC